jgi:hypothetical protein
MFEAMSAVRLRKSTARARGRTMTLTAQLSADFRSCAVGPLPQ